MHPLSTLVTFLTLAVGLASAQRLPTTARWILGRYDYPDTSASRFACASTLYGEGYYNLGKIPFPYVGGLGSTPGSNCLGCYEITNVENGKKIPFLVIDTSPEGISLSSNAIVGLTGVPTQDTIDVTYVQVDQSKCGL